MRSSITGDDDNIFEVIPESCVKSSGTQCCTLKDVNNYPNFAYYKDTKFYYAGYYISKVAIWQLNPTIQVSSDNSSSRIVTFGYEKVSDAFVYYYPNNNSIKVVISGDEEAQVVTSLTKISTHLVGCQTAYVDSCKFEVCLGGNSERNLDYMDNILTVLGWVLEGNEIFGELLPKVSLALDVYSFVDNTLNMITNYNYNQAIHQYQFYPENDLVVKRVGSTFEPLLINKYSILKMTTYLKDVTICPNSRIYFQIQTQVSSNFSGNTENIHMGGSVPLL